MFLVKFFYRSNLLLHVSGKQMRLRLCFEDAMRFWSLWPFLQLDWLVIYLLNFFLLLLYRFGWFNTFVALFRFWTRLWFSCCHFWFYLFPSWVALTRYTVLEIIVKISFVNQWIIQETYNLGLGCSFHHQKWLPCQDLLRSSHWSRRSYLLSLQFTVHIGMLGPAEEVCCDFQACY